MRTNCTDCTVMRSSVQYMNRTKLYFRYINYVYLLANEMFKTERKCDLIGDGPISLTNQIAEWTNDNKSFSKTVYR